MSNSRNTYILLGVLAVLIVASFFLLRPEDDPVVRGQQQQTQQNFLWDYSSEELQALTLRQYNGKQLDMQVVSGTWTMISGTTSTPLDTALVQQGMVLLKKLPISSRFTATDLSNYGLAGSLAPRAVLTMTFASGKTASLWIGDNTATSGRDNLGSYVADAANPNSVTTNTDNTVREIVGWVASPPLIPTPMPTVVLVPEASVTP